MGRRLLVRLKRTKQLGYRTARLSTTRLPVLDACGVDSDPFFALRRNRIEESKTFDEPPSPWAAAVRHDHVIERPALRARSGESNLDHDLKCFLSRRLVKATVEP